MKKIDNFLFWTGIALASCASLFCIGLTGYCMGKLNPDIRVQLPPNAENIKPTDTLKAQLINGVLVIHFNNNQKK